MIKMIAAVSVELAIGANNDLLWHIPEDLRFFKDQTRGYIVVMGYKTWLSLPFKPLPGRRNIVLSRKERVIDGAEVMTVEQVLELSKTSDIFIIGGGEIYSLFAQYADELLITHVNISIDADTFFPDIFHDFYVSETLGEGGNSTPNIEYKMLRYLRSV